MADINCDIKFHDTYYNDAANDFNLAGTGDVQMAYKEELTAWLTNIIPRFGSYKGGENVSFYLGLGSGFN